MKTLKFKVENTYAFKDLMNTIEKEMPKATFSGSDIKPTDRDFLPNPTQYPIGVVIENDIIYTEPTAFLSDGFVKWDIRQSLLDTNPVKEEPMDLGIICYAALQQIEVLRKIENVFPEFTWAKNEKPLQFIPAIDGEDSSSRIKCIFNLVGNRIAYSSIHHKTNALVVCNAVDFLKPDWKYVPPAPEVKQDPDEDISIEKLETEIDKLLAEFKTVIMKNHKHRLAKKGENND